MERGARLAANRSIQSSMYEVYKSSSVELFFFYLHGDFSCGSSIRKTCDGYLIGVDAQIFEMGQRMAFQAQLRIIANECEHRTRQ